MSVTAVSRRRAWNPLEGLTVEQKVIEQLAAAGTGEPYAVEPSARTTASDQVVVGDIPAQRPGFQPRPALLAKLNQAGQEP